METKTFAMVFLTIWYVIHIICILLSNANRKEKIFYIISMLIFLTLAIILIFTVKE